MAKRETDWSPRGLDPSDWSALRSVGHRMLNEMFDHLERIRDRPVWRPMSPNNRELFRQPLPREPADLAATYETFRQGVLPFALGNLHPGFMGWAHGGGTPVGLLAEMLAGALNANLAGRDQAPIEVEKQVVQWVRGLFHFPEGSNGLFVTGTSMGNLIAVLVARSAVIGVSVRERGLVADGKHLVAYASAGAHLSIARAMEISGIGSAALRLASMNDRFQMDLYALEGAIRADRASGLAPFLIVGTAGSTDIGATDDLVSLAAIARRERIWFHVDGAFGALGVLASDIAPRLRGIEEADSLAFDFHKWAQVPYDTGFLLVRDGALQERTFAHPADYLRREEEGMAAGSPWPCDFGPDLSRGFRALKTWFTFQVYGTRRLGEIISSTCALAQYLRPRIEETPELELLAPVPLNIVCFGFRCQDSSRMNARIAVDLQKSGIAAPSTAVLKGKLAIRAAIFNHRTTADDVDQMLEATIRFGRTATRDSRLRGVHE